MNQITNMNDRIQAENDQYTILLAGITSEIDDLKSRVDSWVETVESAERDVGLKTATLETAKAFHETEVVRLRGLWKAAETTLTIAQNNWNTIIANQFVGDTDTFDARRIEAQHALSKAATAEENAATASLQLKAAQSDLQATRPDRKPSQSAHL